MLMAVDIGNSSIVLGVFAGEKLLNQFRLQTDLGRTEDEYGATIDALLRYGLGGQYSFSRAIICSVVPPLTPILQKFFSERLGVPSLVVGPGMKTGISIHIDDPRSVGADRIVNALAVKTLYGTPAVVIDFGTAISFDYIAADGSYQGSVIAPGIETSVTALVERAAKLPMIELSWPSSIIGKNTVAAMQSGSVVGSVSLVDGMIDFIESEKGKLNHIVATGAAEGELISKHSKRIKLFNSALTLQGIRLLSQINPI
jgi:type III pantothenate kinase